MKRTIQRRPAWKCRVAERLGVVSDVGRDRRSADRSGIWIRWASRHVDGCEWCLAERNEWERITQAMRAIERPVAPDHLLYGVMAKIARERVVQKDEATERLVSSWSSAGYEVAMLLVTTMLGIVTAWSFLMMSVPEGFARLYQVFTVGFAVWKNAVSEITAYGMTEMLSGGLGLHYSVLIWTLAGLGITVGVLRIQQR